VWAAAAVFGGGWVIFGRSVGEAAAEEACPAAAPACGGRRRRGVGAVVVAPPPPHTRSATRRRCGGAVAAERERRQGGGTAARGGCWCAEAVGEVVGKARPLLRAGCSGAAVGNAAEVVGDAPSRRREVLTSVFGYGPEAYQ